MSLYDEIVPPCLKMLDNMDAWLDLGAAHAEAKKFDVGNLLAARLAPDQFALTRQVQAACDQAKGAASRAAGKDMPKHEDTEKTLPELHGRIQKVREYLKSFSKADFEGAESRHVTLSFMPGVYMLAGDYTREMALPNFYFHATLVYEILRANGVDLGKRHFIGSLTTHKS